MQVPFWVNLKPRRQAIAKRYHHERNTRAAWLVGFSSVKLGDGEMMMMLVVVVVAILFSSQVGLLCVYNMSLRHSIAGGR